MSGRRGPRGLATAIKGVVIAGLLASLLSGCAGGESQATAADDKFSTIDHVVGASTSVSRPGLPTNTHYFAQIELDEGLTVQQAADVVDSAVVVAREELAPTASAGVELHFYTAASSAELKEIVPMLGDVGSQFGLSDGNLGFTREALRAYVSPDESS